MNEIDSAFYSLNAKIKSALMKCKEDVNRNAELVESETVKRFAIELASELYCIPEQNFTLHQALHIIDNLVERWLRK